ncbi:MAG TPA: TRAP transporter large permease subunit [Bdellovibrionota bacterium]|nr:TRAP transporter large permease subunit [Bdellovibrionota bacterium]
MILLFILLFIFLILIGTPLFIVIASIGGACFYFSGSDLTSSAAAMVGEIYKLATAPVLLTIPLFTFAGFILAEGGAPKRIVRLARALLGWMPGGIAVVALITCAFFTAFTGASGATIIALGGLLYPILQEDRYPEKFDLGLISTCGSLGLLFPPSVPLILYGIIAETNIDDLFLAGMVPGFLLIVLLSLYSGKKALSFNVKRDKFSLQEVISACRGAMLDIPLPLIILLGIYGVGGWFRFTVTEASAVTALYVFVIEVLIFREVSITKDLPRIVRESMLLVGGILIILASALGLTNYFVDAQIPTRIFEFLSPYILNKWIFLFVLNIFLLIVGCLMDIFSATIVVVPLILPIAKQFDINPLHLGIIFLTNLEIGYITPPVGINLFISSFRFKKPILSIYKACVPFLLVLLFALLIITYVPDLSLGLLKLMGK